MTRRIRTALGSALVGLLLAASSSVVGADAPHILAATGIGQEHFAAMSVDDASFVIAAPATTN